MDRPGNDRRYRGRWPVETNFRERRLFPGFCHDRGKSNTNATEIVNMDLFTQIFTGQIPYYEYPRDLTVLSKVNRGIRPTRPGHETAPELTDHIWAIMQDCWRDVPSDRPTVDEVLERLPEDGLSLPRLRAAQAELRNNISAQRNSKLSVSDIGFLSDTVSGLQRFSASGIS